MKNLISIKKKIIGWGGLEAFSGSFWFYRIPKRRVNCSYQELFKMSSPCLLSIYEHVCALPIKIGNIFSSSNYGSHNEIYPAPFHIVSIALSRQNTQLPWVSSAAWQVFPVHFALGKSLYCASVELLALEKLEDKTLSLNTHAMYTVSFKGTFLVHDLSFFWQSA